MISNDGRLCVVNFLIWLKLLRKREITFWFLELIQKYDKPQLELQEPLYQRRAAAFLAEDSCVYRIGSSEVTQRSVKDIPNVPPHWWRKVSPAVVFVFFSPPFLSSLHTNPTTINHIHPYPTLRDWNYFLKVSDTLHYSSLLPSKPTNWKEITKFEQTPRPDISLLQKLS